MSLFLILSAVITILVLAFVLTHLRTLTEEEVKLLAKKRRDKEIRAYYTFNSRELIADKDFKKKMNNNGAFYPMNESLNRFPSLAAALLKSKKHEWVIVAFEKDKNIELIWLNKGSDRNGVTMFLSTETILETSKLKGYQTIIRLHNHPNSDPKRYTCAMPSPQDMKAAIEFSRSLNNNGINLVEFVCERGKHHEYWLSPADSFYPMGDYLSAVSEVNGLSWKGNFGLHFERIFKSKLYNT